MSSRFHRTTRAAVLTAMLVLGICTVTSMAFAQSDDGDPEMRIQQLENQLRQLTGQNEELQYRNRQLEDRLRSLQGAAPGAARRGSARTLPPRPRRSPPIGSPRHSPDYDPQVAAPAPIVQEPQGVPQAPGRRRGDAFDPNQNPNAPGAPRALGGGQMPVPNDAPVGAPGGRDAGEPLDLASMRPGSAGVARRQARALTTLAAVGDAEGRIRSRHRLHAAQGLCAGRRDHAQFRSEIPKRSRWSRIRNTGWARAFSSASNIATPPKSFLAVTTKFDKSAKAPGCAAAARPVAGGVEGKGSRLCRVRRGDAEISARLGRRESRRRPRAEAG